MSVKGDVVFGIKWLSVALCLMRVSRFVTTVVLARLLEPQAFGIIAMANVVIDSIRMIREVGFGSAYIQKQFKEVETDRIAANTTFFMGLIINIFLFCSCFLLVPNIAKFFKSPQLELVLKIMIVSFLIDALTNIPSLILRKQLQFAKHAICEIIEAISYALIAITLAVFGFDVWSIVFGLLGSKFFFGLMVFKSSNWRPSLEFSFKIAKELFSYGKYIWGFGLLSAVGTAIDKAIVGRFWGATALGYYNVAFSICTLPVTPVKFLLNKITFPVFSKLQDDNIRLKRNFIRILSYVSIISMPISLGLMAVSEQFVFTVLGPKWQQVIPLIQVLSFFGLFISVSSVSGNAINAIGKPKFMLYANGIGYIVLISFLLLFRNYGVFGVTYAKVITAAVSFIMVFSLIIYFLEMPLLEVFEPMFRSFFSSVIMVVVIYGLKNILTQSYFPVWISFISMVFTGILSYFLATLLFNKFQFLNFKHTFLDIINSKGKLI